MKTSIHLLSVIIKIYEKSPEGNPSGLLIARYKILKMYSNFRSLPSSIQTVLSVLEFHQVNHYVGRGLYRRSGFSPCPEGYSIYFILLYHSVFYLSMISS